MNSSLDETVRRSRLARDIMKQYPELETILAQIGRPDDGTDATGFFNAEFSRAAEAAVTVAVLPVWSRRRTKPELIAGMSHELGRILIGVDWSFSQNIRDNVMEALSGVKGENSVKVIGPDLMELERLGERRSRPFPALAAWSTPAYSISWVNRTWSFHRSPAVARWGVSVADVQDVIATAVAGKSVSQMIEGERSFDIALRWPERLRSDESAILNIPVDVSHNVVSSGTSPSLSSTPVSGAAGGPSATGSSAALPTVTGASGNAPLNDLSRTPRRRLIDLVTRRGLMGARFTWIIRAAGCLGNLPRTRTTPDCH